MLVAGKGWVDVKEWVYKGPKIYNPEQGYQAAGFEKEANMMGWMRIMQVFTHTDGQAAYAFSTTKQTEQVAFVWCDKGDLIEFFPWHEAKMQQANLHLETTYYENDEAEEAAERENEPTT